MSTRTQLDDLWDFGVRGDGRAPEDLRRIETEMGIFHPQASGSASFSFGNTKVIAAVYGPHEPSNRSKKSQNPDKMSINCEYSSACFASNERKSSTKNDRKSIELSSHLKCLIGNVVVEDTLIGSQIDVYVELIQDDGGSYAACINAATLALADAGIPLRDYVVACTATITNSMPMLDLNSLERGFGLPELTIGILAKSSQIVVLEQSHCLQHIHLNEVLNIGIEGCRKVHHFLEETAREKFNRIHQALTPVIH